MKESEKLSYNNELKSEDSESLISKTLDVFLFGPLLSVLPRKFITRHFISGFLLSVFLIWLYSSKSLIEFDLSPHMIVLYVIILLTIGEFLRKNFPILNNWFSNDRKSINFFENINSMTDDQMRQFVKFHYFSSKCINKFISILKMDINKIPPDIIEYALTTQDLTKENLDCIFSEEIVLDEKIVKYILVQKIDQLTEENITNIHKKFCDNTDLLKVLFATQSASKKILLRNHDEMLNSLFNDYQKQKKQINFWLKIFPISWCFISRRKTMILISFTIIAFSSCVIITLLAMYYSTICNSSCTTIDSFFQTLFSLWLFGILISFVISKPVTNWIIERHIQYYIWRIENHEFPSK